jgi:hypothetical protein
MMEDAFSPEENLGGRWAHGGGLEEEEEEAAAAARGEGTGGRPVPLPRRGRDSAA